MSDDKIWNKESAGKDWAIEGRGDDPTVRERHEPTGSGPGDGQAFFFLFGLNRHRETDQKMVEREREAIRDDIEVLCRAGYTVVVDPQATRDDLLEALTGRAERPPAGIYWSAHGHPDGSIETCDGGRVRPDELEADEVRSELRLFIMSACYSAAQASSWRRALGGHALVVGWGRPVSIDRAVDFLTPREETDTDLDDLIERYLIERRGLPVAADAGAVANIGPPIRGDVERIQPLMDALSEALASPWRESEGSLEIRVGLPDNRRQVVRVCSVDSAQPLTTGQALFAVESEVGELTSVVDVGMLLRGFGAPGLSRVALVRGDGDLPLIVAQGFVPLERASLEQLASVVVEVASRADELERRLFGADVG